MQYVPFCKVISGLWQHNFNKPKSFTNIYNNSAKILIPSVFSPL